MAVDKQLKFTMVVDQNSVQQVQEAVRKMVQEFDHLTAAISRASAAMGGLLGGGKAGAPAGPTQTIGSSAYHPASGPTSSSTSTAIPTGHGNQGVSVTEALRQQAEAFRQTAAAAQTATQSMTDKIGQMVRQSVPLLQQLSNATRGALPAGNQQLLLGPGNAIVPSGGQAINLVRGPNGVWGMPPPGGGFGGGPGWGSSTPNPAGGGFSGGGAVLGALGIAGLVAGIGMAIKGVIQSGAELWKSSQFLGADLAAERGNLVGSNFRAAIAGDASWLYNKQMAAQKYGKLRDWAATNNTDYFSDKAIGASIKGMIANSQNSAVDPDYENPHRSIDAMTGEERWDKGYSPTVRAGLSSAYDQSVEIGRAQAVADAEAKYAASPEGIKQNAYFGIIQDQLGMRKAYGRFTGQDLRRDWKNNTVEDTAGRFMAGAQERGWGDGGALLGSIMSQSRLGGGRSGWRTGESALQGGAAGMNPASILAMSTAASPGGRGIGDFASAVYGKNGLDRWASESIGEGISQGMMRSGIAFNDSGAIAAAGASGLFNGKEGDWLAAQNWTKGLTLGGAFNTGDVDKFSGGMAAAAASLAVGKYGGNLTTELVLAKQFGGPDGMAMLQEIASGRVKPNAWQANAGINQKNAKEYLDLTMKATLGRGGAITEMESEILENPAAARKKYGKEAFANTAGMMILRGSPNGVTAPQAISLAANYGVIADGGKLKINRGGVPGAFRGEIVKGADTSKADMVKSAVEGYEADERLRQSTLGEKGGTYASSFAANSAVAKKQLEIASKEGMSAQDLAGAFSSLADVIKRQLIPAIKGVGRDRTQ